MVLKHRGQASFGLLFRPFLTGTERSLQSFGILETSRVSMRASNSINSRCSTLAAVSLMAFAALVATWQFVHSDDMHTQWSSIAQSVIKGKTIARISDIVERDMVINSANGNCRTLDLTLPENVRFFITGMTGTTNDSKGGYYYFLTYFLFPRDVAVSLDRPRFTLESIEGRSTESDQEMIANGFDIRIDKTSDMNFRFKSLRLVPSTAQANPIWFDSRRDIVIAFLLPLLTALSGMWLLRWIFTGLSEGLPILDKMACGLGLGMMAVAALTLGVKLCGFHGRGLVLALTAAGSLAELWRDRKVFGNAIAGGFHEIATDHIAAVILGAGVVVFVILFRLSGLQGIVEFDAVADWMFKAKIFFLCTGHEIVGWFSNPRLGYAHLDYPTLVPSLHAATYDSIGHVDEFVSKFWPAWMLLFLLAALASLSRGKSARFHAPLYFLLGILLLPFTQSYVQMEGGTLPMVFFTVMGFVQCALGLLEKDRARIGLGLTLLFGAAMTKFEGMIFLAVIAGWILLLPSARQLLKPSPRLWRMLAFCFLAALPFICLRVQIPVLHPESGWSAYVLAHPGMTFSSAPKILLIMLARLFVNPDFAKWSADNGQLHWTGHWNGLSSLYNDMTLGLAWVGLLLTVMLWFAVPARRPIILWTLAVFMSATIAMSVVFASFVSISGLNHVIFERTVDNTTGRYLFPMLLAWASTMVIMLFRNIPPSTSTDTPTSRFKF
jgi:hypothetical protein